ncbi:MAG: LPS export ABC transporter permease LptG [Legionellaceae bacterium]|nr:LPS export ABC transporter permease LptG [Legionellaceae bacterium]
MKLIDRYIAKTVLASIALVILMLTGLQIFILFVNELGDLGRGGYHLSEALKVVMLEVPEQVYLFFPVACLLGALVGLGNLATHRELLVMQASGVSIKRVTWAVLKASVFVILFVTVLGEVLVPRFLATSHDIKSQALTGGQAVRTSHGVWLRHENNFMLVGDVLADHSLRDIYQFQFDTTHHMRFTRKIDALVEHDGVWQAQGVDETRFSTHKTNVKHYETMPWDIPLDLAVLKLRGETPDEMSFVALHHYVVSQQASPALFPYKLAYWQRLVQPFSTVVMMILAIPFVFGPLRSSTMGAKLLTGATVGFSFHLVNRFFGPFSQVFLWSPEMAAIAPTLVFAILGAYWMGRTR